MSEPHDTVARSASKATPAPQATHCPRCAKGLEGEPNFCPACGADMRGLSANSDTLDGPLRSRLIDGRYRLLEKLGEGGMGSVYKVEHARMGKVAALKLLRPDHALDRGLKARFLQEARVVAKLSHPNTVQVFDSGELADGALFITMEYVPGKDLAWHLKAHGPISEDKAVAIGIQLLASLQEAHEYGIIHRDLKPANIMLVRRRSSGDDQIKLLDFGIAKLQEAEGRKSITGDFVGTPAYMSPEQIRGESVDARSDLYSLGALLFELVTGKPLFDGPTPISIVTQHTQAPVPFIAQVAPQAQISPGFEAVLRQALSKSASDRFSDAEAMRAALLKLRRSMGLRTADFTPVPQPVAEKMLSREDFDQFERRLRLRRTLAPLVALAILSAGALAAFKLTARNSAQQLSEEVEPNDLVSQATRVAPNTDIRGTMGASATPTQRSDRDLFVAHVPAGPVRITLGGVPDLNLTLEALQTEPTDTGEKLRRHVFLDDVGPGGSERVDALMVREGNLYLRIEEKPFVTEANRPSRERALVPYSLRIEPMPEGVWEQEPNDTPSTAQGLPLTKALTAFAGAHIDDLDRLSAMRPDAAFSAADWFRLDDIAPGDTAMVALVPPDRGALSVIDGSALENYLQKMAAAGPKRPSPPPPKPVLVKGTVSILEVKPNDEGMRLLRVWASSDALAGATYQLAVATTGPNGLAALLDLAKSLEAEGRTASRAALLNSAAEQLAKSPDIARLTEALVPSK